MRLLESTEGVALFGPTVFVAARSFKATDCLGYVYAEAPCMGRAVTPALRKYKFGDRAW